MQQDTDPAPRADLVAVVFPLVEALRKMLAEVESLWSHQDINPSEAAVLERLFIDHNGSARSGDLLGHPIRSTPALGKVLASLESKDLANRNRSAKDGRIVIVSGTEKAKQLYEDMIERILTKVVGPTTADLSDRDFAQLDRLTRKLRPPQPSR
jgi:DNA-binding MarR family transcriptional regulator